MARSQDISFGDLPDEVTEVVLAQLAASTTRKQEWTRARLVCRQWNYILEPALISDVRFSYNHDASGGSRVSVFLNFLDLKPHLGLHVVSLSLRIQRNNDWIYSRILRILDTCTKLQQISLDVDLDDQDLPVIYRLAIHQRFLALLKKIATMCLSELSLFRVSFDSIIAFLSGSSINTLILTECGWSGTAGDPVANLGYDRVPSGSSAEYHGQGHIKRLFMVEPVMDTILIDCFMRWPAALEDFYLVVENGEIAWSVEHPPEEFFPPDPIYQMLQSQRHSLRTFRYDCKRGPKIQPDFSDFEVLTTLEIIIPKFENENARPPVQDIFVPKLRNLRIMSRKDDNNRYHRAKADDCYTLLEILSDDSEGPNLKPGRLYVKRWPTVEQKRYSSENRTITLKFDDHGDWLTHANQVLEAHGVKIIYIDSLSIL